jgi:hypothetical protein
MKLGLFGIGIVGCSVLVIFDLSLMGWKLLGLLDLEFFMPYMIVEA